MRKYFNYLILLISVTCLASAFNFPLPEISETQGIYEVETKSEIEQLVFSLNVLSPLLLVLSFPNYINLRPQLEVLEFIKPPSF